jgi:Galactosyltransferase
MSVLVAVKSCLRDCAAGHHEIIESTWGKHLGSGVDLQFFTGMKEGELFPHSGIALAVPDGYTDLPYKVREILYYFLAGTWDYVFLCDTDTFVIPELLFTCGYEGKDYVGTFIKGLKPGQIFRHDFANPMGGRTIIPEDYASASGGRGYFLSRKAAQIIADTEPKIWADDEYVGLALGPHIQSGEIVGYQPPDYDLCTFHFPKHVYKRSYFVEARWMEKMYTKHFKEN